MRHIVGDVGRGGRACPRSCCGPSGERRFKWMRLAEGIGAGLFGACIHTSMATRAATCLGRWPGALGVQPGNQPCLFDVSVTLKLSGLSCEWANGWDPSFVSRRDGLMQAPAVRQTLAGGSSFPTHPQNGWGTGAWGCRRAFLSGLRGPFSHLSSLWHD